MSFKDAETKPLDPAAIRDNPVEDLTAELERLQEAQFRLKFRAATEDMSADNPMRFRMLRRNIARIKTVIRERKDS